MLVLATACVLLGSGCATKTVQHRGWIGGSLSEAHKSSCSRYSGGKNIPALPREIAENQKKAVFVSRVHPDTPVAQADLREGDLITKVNGEIVGSLKDFDRRVRESATASRLELDVYRDGQIISGSIIVGKETYRKGGRFSMGLKVSTNLKIGLLSPNFDILGLLSFDRNKVEPELHAPEWQYFNAIESQSSRRTYLTPQGEPYAPGKGWDLWLGVFGLEVEEQIIRQEMAEVVEQAEATAQ